MGFVKNEHLWLALVPFFDAYINKYVKKNENNTKIFIKKFSHCIFDFSIYNIPLFWQTFSMDFEVLFCYNENRTKNMQKA